MRLFGYVADGRPALGELVGDRLRPLPTAETLPAILARDPDLAGIRGRGSDDPDAAAIAVASVRPAPAVARPAKIVCVGLNYRDHVREGAGREVPERPLLFAKFANAIVADGEAIVRPEGTGALDLEVELGLVIGRR